MTRPTITNPRKMPARERREFFAMQDALRRIEHDLHHEVIETRSLPKGWDEIAKAVPESHPRRTKVTAAFDADVVKFFKGLGTGYQKRMNLVLRAYMHGRLSKLVKGPDQTDWALRPDRIPERAPAVDWGDAEIDFAEIHELLLEGTRLQMELAKARGEPEEEVAQIAEKVVELSRRGPRLIGDAAMDSPEDLLKRMDDKDGA